MEMGMGVGMGREAVGWETIGWGARSGVHTTTYHIIHYHIRQINMSIRICVVREGMYRGIKANVKRRV